MQRLAVQIAGEPRFSQETTDFIQTIAREYRDWQVDWFFHLWNRSNTVSEYFQRRLVHPRWAEINDPLEVKNRISRHLPEGHRVAAVEIASPDSIMNPYKENVLNNIELRLFNMYRMLYSMRACDRLRVQAESSIGLYNLVIRGRADIQVTGDLPHELPPNQVLMSRDNLHGSPAFPTNDMFLVGNSRAMSCIADMFLHLGKIGPYCVYEGRPHPETLLGFYCRQQQLDLRSSDFRVVLRPLYNEQLHQQVWGSWGD
jgi:hypothetical protein